MDIKLPQLCQFFCQHTTDENDEEQKIEAIKYLIDVLGTPDAVKKVYQYAREQWEAEK